jgi:DNA mismatch repair protein MutL
MQHNDVRIEVLPQSVVEKISAGEVIERPASVLKELVENALDAQATKIDIVVEDSGFSLIQVSDNGTGMSRENLEKSLLAHATSKIRTAEDLYAIATMGFRGEALASVGAVSRLTIASSAAHDGLGHSVACDGGAARPSQPVSHVRGTTVSCRDLFFNVPARKKFMKTRKAERIALLKLVEQLAVPFPAIHFTAVFEGKTVFDAPAVDSLADRISQVTGIDFAAALTRAQGSAEGMEATLFFPLSASGESRPRYQYLYVNLRRVDNESVMFAVREAFAKLVQRDFRPSYFCFIDVDPDRIDVNVHPTKQKIKFEKERELFGFIFGIVSRAIEPSLRNGGAAQGHSLADARVPQSTPSRNEYAPSTPDSRDFYPETSGPAPGHVVEEKPDGLSEQIVLSFPSREGNREKGLDSAADERIQLVDAQEAASWSLISCYQIHEMYILAPIKNGILLIDQHAAHERILFEQALSDLALGKATSQQLLFPVVLQLSATEKAVVESAGGYFRAFGFDVQDFGGMSVSVSAIPAFMKNSDAERSARDMIQYLLDEKGVGAFPDPRERFAAAFACGAAIKAGQKLSQEEMNALLNNLFSAHTPYTCPHGRPTVVRISLDELSRRFLR